jgi:Kef-type K+ transport system membrane component KefB
MTLNELVLSAVLVVGGAMAGWSAGVIAAKRGRSLIWALSWGSGFAIAVPVIFLFVSCMVEDAAAGEFTMGHTLARALAISVMYSIGMSCVTVPISLLFCNVCYRRRNRSAAVQKK